MFRAILPTSCTVRFLTRSDLCPSPCTIALGAASLLAPPEGRPERAFAAPFSHALQRCSLKFCAVLPPFSYALALVALLVNMRFPPLLGFGLNEFLFAPTFHLRLSSPFSFQCFLSFLFVFPFAFLFCCLFNCLLPCLLCSTPFLLL